jgi:hypothetical protein
MHDRETMEFDRLQESESQESPSLDISAFIPRLWMILILLAVPFFSTAVYYFEAFERTGPVGAFLAAPLLSATFLGYVSLILVLKKRKL